MVYTPRLSLLMTVRNGQRHLAATLESVLEQSFTDFELLVIDDGSTDSTLQILEDYARQDQRINVLRNVQNAGIPRSMNKLFLLARGTYMVRHDGDDISLPYRCQRQIQFLDTHPEIGLIASQVQVIDDNGALMPTKIFDGPADNLGIQEQLLDHNCLCQGSVMFRRELLDKVGLYNELFAYSQDYDLWLKMAEVTQLARLDEPLYLYRMHTDSVSQKHQKLQAVFTAEALDQAVQRRFGKTPSRAQWKTTAQAYLKAALINAIAEDWETADKLMARALNFESALFDVEQPLETYLVDYTHRDTIEKRVELYKNIFDKLLLRHSTASRFRNRILGRLHFSEVFRAAQAGGAWGQVDRHLWPGILCAPGWLPNRGVMVIILKTIFWRLRKTFGGARE